MTDVCDLKKRIQSATNALTTGAPVLIVSGADDQEVADVLIPAALASPRWTAWAVRYTSGLLCSAMRSTRADELELPAMVRGNGFSATTPAFGIGVDAAAGVGTGISATDRSRTARVLASPQTRPVDLTRPGHILPLRTAPRGVIEHRNSAEAAVDLCEIAGLPPVALTATLLSDDGTLLQGTELAAFARVQRRSSSAAPGCGALPPTSRRRPRWAGSPYCYTDCGRSRQVHARSRLRRRTDRRPPHGLHRFNNACGSSDGVHRLRMFAPRSARIRLRVPT